MKQRNYVFLRKLEIPTRSPEHFIHANENVMNLFPFQTSHHRPYQTSATDSRLLPHHIYPQINHHECILI